MDPDGDALTFYTNADEVLPDSFNSTFGFNNTDGMFVWAPAYNDYGSYNVTFNVTDGELWDSESVLIEVVGIKN